MMRKRDRPAGPPFPSSSMDQRIRQGPCRTMIRPRRPKSVGGFLRRSPDPDPSRPRPTMSESLKNLAASTGVDAGTIEKILGGVLSFLKTRVSPETYETIEAKIPEAHRVVSGFTEAETQAEGSDGGLLGKVTDWPGSCSAASCAPISWERSSSSASPSARSPRSCRSFSHSSRLTCRPTSSSRSPPRSRPSRASTRPPSWAVAEVETDTIDYPCRSSSFRMRPTDAIGGGFEVHVRGRRRLDRLGGDTHVLDGLQDGQGLGVLGVAGPQLDLDPQARLEVLRRDRLRLRGGARRGESARACRLCWRGRLRFPLSPRPRASSRPWWPRRSTSDSASRAWFANRGSRSRPRRGRAVDLRSRPISGPWRRPSWSSSSPPARRDGLIADEIAPDDVGADGHDEALVGGVAGRLSAGQVLRRH